MNSIERTKLKCCIVELQNTTNMLQSLYEHGFYEFATELQHLNLVLNDLRNRYEVELTNA